MTGEASRQAPDVAAAGANPVLHYPDCGIAEDRAIGADLSWSS